MVAQRTGYPGTSSRTHHPHRDEDLADARARQRAQGLCGECRHQLSLGRDRGPRHAGRAGPPTLDEHEHHLRGSFGAWQRRRGASLLDGDLSRMGDGTRSDRLLHRALEGDTRSGMVDDRDGRGGGPSALTAGPPRRNALPGRAGPARVRRRARGLRRASAFDRAPVPRAAGGTGRHAGRRRRCST